MVYGHCYGPLGLVTRKGTGQDGPQRAGFPQPFDWPDWLYPTKMYSFRSGPPKVEQLAYMYNDANAPFVHLMLMTMLQIASETLDDVSSVEEALSLTASRFFSTNTSAATTHQSSGAATKRKSSPAIPIKRPSAEGPDLWSSLGGIPPGASDAAILDALMFLPDDVLVKIQNFMDLDTEDEDDADFIELYGGLLTLARASNVIEDHGLLHGVSKKAGVSVSSASDEAYASGESYVDRMDTTSGDPPSSSSRSTASPALATFATAEQGTQSEPDLRHSEVQVCLDPARADQATQAQEPPPKRRRISVEVWIENGEIRAHIPPDSLPAGPADTAERRVPVPATDCDRGDQSSALEVDDPPPVEDAEEAGPDPEPKLRAPQDVLPEERLRLLAGYLHDIDVPDMTEIPSRFGASPDFGPRCVQCGHKQDPNKPNRMHAVDACPVLGKYGAEAYNPGTGIWVTPPCLYPLCPRNGHHFTKMCPELQSLCLRCGLRGHSAPRCDLATLEHSKEALANMYSVFKSFGLRSRKVAHSQDWDFEPTIPSFRVVTHQKKNYLLPWTDQKINELSELDSQEIKAELLQELYK